MAFASYYANKIETTFSQYSPAQEHTKAIYERMNLLYELYEWVIFSYTMRVF